MGKNITIKCLNLPIICITAYSKEENTKAYNFDNQIDEELKEIRLQKIMAIQKEVSLELNK